MNFETSGRMVAMHAVLAQSRTIRKRLYLMSGGRCIFKKLRSSSECRNLLSTNGRSSLATAGRALELCYSIRTNWKSRHEQGRVLEAKKTCERRGTF